MYVCMYVCTYVVCMYVYIYTPCIRMTAVCVCIYIYISTKATSKFSVPARCDSSGDAQELAADPASWLKVLGLGVSYRCQAISRIGFRGLVQQYKTVRGRNVRDKTTITKPGFSIFGKRESRDAGRKVRIRTSRGCLTERLGRKGWGFK